MNEKELLVNEFRAMGTDVSLEIVAQNEKEQAAASAAFVEVKNIFEENEKIFSRFNANSELSKINSNLGKEQKISESMLDVLVLCLKFYKISGGYFDPRVIGNLEKIGYSKDFKSHDLNTNSAENIDFEKTTTNLEDDLIVDAKEKTVLAKKRIDTTGIAKGWTVDQAAKYLSGNNFQNFRVDAGGDMSAVGRNEIGELWEMGIEGLDNDKIKLKLNNEGVATSGISRKRWQKGEKKFHHLVNPKNPHEFSFDIKTVTVIADKTVEADGRAKVLVLMGKEKGMEFAKRNKLKALFLDYKGSVYLSDEVKNNIVEREI